MAYKSQNYERHGAAGLDFSTVRGVRVERFLGGKATKQILDIRNSLLECIDAPTKYVRLRSHKTYAVTILGSSFVSEQMPKDSTFEDDLGLAFEIYGRLPDTKNKPLKDVETSGLVLLGLPSWSCRPLAIRLKSPELTEENRVAKSVLSRTVGFRKLINDQEFVPHIIIANVSCGSPINLKPAHKLPAKLVLSKLMFS